MTRLEAVRKRRELTQTVVAALAGLHQGQISLIERRRLRPTEGQAAALARALGLEVGELLEEVPTENHAEVASR